jgi:hypothetical protein
MIDVVMVATTEMGNAQLQPFPVHDAVSPATARGRPVSPRATPPR